MVGIRRQIESFKAKEQNEAHNPKYGWHIDIEGACAEMAFAKHFGLYWDGSVNTFKAPDVGLMQVRSTMRLDGGLIIRPKDEAHERYALVVGSTRCPNELTGGRPGCGYFVMVGWMLGSDIKQDKYLAFKDSDTPAWLVPQRDLHPFESKPLPPKIEGNEPINDKLERKTDNYDVPF